MQIPEVIDKINKYKYDAKNLRKPMSDYDRGIYNGLELVAALLEKRPSFLLNMNNEFNKSDIEHYPEFFL